MLAGYHFSSADDWPMFQHDPQHTGSTSSDGPASNVSLWQWILRQPARFTSMTPTVVQNRLYVGSTNTPYGPNWTFTVFCKDATTGQSLWNFTGDGAYPSPVAYSGNVYFGSYNGYKVYCVNATGNGDGSTHIQWVFQTVGSVVSPPVVVNERCYVSTGDMGAGGRLYCLDATGYSNGTTKKYWEFSGGSIPSLAVAGNMVFTSTNGYFYCLNASTGTVRWQTPLLGASSPAVRNGKVYVGSGLNMVSCFDENDGHILWNYTMPGVVLGTSTPVVSDDIVAIIMYVNLSISRLLCLRSLNGSLLWAYGFNGYNLVSPVIANERVYLGPVNHEIDCHDAETGALVWKYTSKDSGMSSPIIANGKLYATFYNTLICIGVNHAPLFPSLSGPTEGSVNSSYTFFGNAIDPDYDSLSYKFDWGDGTTSTWTSFVSSGTQMSVMHGWTLAGTYEIRVKTKDISGVESSWSSPKSIVITSAPSTLLIAAPSSVIEGESFTVTITVDGTPVDNAAVLFSTATSTTDTNGVVTLTSPSVSHDTQYTITVSHEGYSTATKTITVLHQPEQSGDRGWVFGVVYSTTGDPLEGATVCILLSSDETGATRQCTLTDNQGRYNSKPTLIGTYTVEVTKDGYLYASKPVSIQKNAAMAVDFTLEKSTIMPPPDPTRVQINKAILTGNVGGEITIQKTSENTISYQQTIYADITITPLTINPQEKTISFSVNGDEQNTGSTIILTLEKNTIFDQSNDLNIEYDNHTITQIANNLTDALNPNDDGFIPEYFIMQDTDGTLLLFISIPHFSGHTITITSVVEALGGVVAVTIYIIAGGLAFVFFIIPAFKGTPIFFSKKKKEKSK
jgi:eukaryotic-like serine/threonine-protein kinase